MICTSIQGKNLEQIFELLETVEMAEIRLDLCPLDEEDIEVLFSEADVPLIATCRIASPDAHEKLLKAIEAGAKYADLETEAPSWMGRSVRQACQKYGSVLIRSWHDTKGTPSLDSLLSVLEKCRCFGGEIVKIVTTAHSEADLEVFDALYHEAEAGTLVAFAMGESGRESRINALKYGAPFTYACTTEDEATAPGQMTTAEMYRAVYGDFRFVSGEGLRMPSSKSFAQRAIVFAALADGTSVLKGFSPCGDVQSAIEFAEAIGAKVEKNEDTLRIRGIAAKPGCLDVDEVSAGESGLLARLAIPLLSVLAKGEVRVTGTGSLPNRALAEAHDVMAPFGVRLYPEKAAPRKEDILLPVKVAGPIIPGRAEVSGRSGSQLISGLLAALPLAQGKSALYVSEPRSIPYLFITLDVLKRFGIHIGSQMEGDKDFMENQDWSHCSEVSFQIRGSESYSATSVEIEADWSGAAPFLAAGAIFGECQVEGLDTQSLQADISILDILLDAGASISQLDTDENGLGPVHVKRAPLNRFDTDLTNCPDLFPVVAVLAAFCPGESHIRGVERLRHKETDRAAAIAQMLEQMDVPVEIAGDEMSVTGMSLTQRILNGKLLRGGRYTSSGDHRMAMALALASLGASAPVEIDDTECVAKSFPEFNKLFERL